MKLQIASDIHREFGHSPNVPDVGADVLVLAGDIGMADDETVEWLRGLSGRYEAVLYVPGNHEFYGKDLDDANSFMNGMSAFGGYEWMNNQAVQVGERRFVGSPLWANFCHEPLSMFNAGRAINDFRRIRHGGGLMTPATMLDLHTEAVAFLTETVKPDDIVITHWPPTLMARNTGFPMDDIAKYFCADIPKVVASTRPELWICGHTHYNVDFMFGETRILSNQGGYPHETIAGYDPGRIVEV